MTGERWQQIERAFYSVLEVPVHRRPVALDELCAGDKALREKVEALLETHDQEDPELLSFSLNKLFAQALAEPRLQIGQTLGNYRVVRPIGSGGMGQIYEGLDTRLGRRVAIKLLSVALNADPEMAMRFEREVRLASSLNHPNILIVYDVGEVDGQRYLVTEFVEGETLRHRLTSGPLPFPETVSVLTQVASALQAAHQAGIIHRDIKPENIIVRPDQVVRLLDFGLAKVSVGDQDLQESRLLLGTVPYMSPEQLRGERVDARTDLWSLGVVLYELAAGTTPFQGETPHHLSVAIMEEEASALPQSATRLASIAARCLEKDPERRYPSATELLKDLNSLPRGAAQVRTPARRLFSPNLLGGAAIAFAAVAGLALVNLTIWQNRSPARPYVRIAPLTTNGSTHYAAISPDGRFLAFTKSDSAGQSLWVRQLEETRDLQLVPAVRRFGGVAFANKGDSIYYTVYGDDRVATLYRVPVLSGEPRVIIRNIDSPPALSTDDRKVAFIRIKQGSSLMTANSEDGVEQLVAKRAAPDMFREAGPAWSPDGTRIAVATVNRKEGNASVQLKVFDAATGRSVDLGPAWTDIDRIAWSRNSENVFVTGRPAPGPSELFRVAYPSGKLSWLTSDLASYFDVTMQADGRNLSAVRESRTSYLYLEPPARRAGNETAHYSTIATGPDGKLLAISDASGQTEVWTVGADGAGKRLTSDGSTKPDLSACRSTNFILFASSRSGGSSIWRVDSDGRGAKALTSGNCCDRRPQCSPDGRTVLFQSNRGGRLSAWSVPVEGGPLHQLTNAVCQDPVWSPDGKTFACHFSGPESIDKWTVAILPASGGAPLRLVDGIARQSEFHWNPQGTALLYVVTEKNISNLWRKPLVDGRAVQLTHFKEDRIFQFVQMENGGFAYIRGNPGEDAVRITWDGR